ncbi:DUF305 domain-containing protein [Actinocatenispora rupis]|uniref:Lipoprotein n=1 Tax=Actinocatenispora rupis TaxID=519421 RepID=A0A8J3J4E7_9ACTN|nr:DUF305 domain-containing protein [Actinocatenispora rupis]GID11416.1 lipoprotein [Actinocatenispora rupis]
MFRHTYVRRALLAVTAGAAVLTVAAGCGGKGTDHSGMPGMGGSASASAAKGDHNSADVMFAQMMIPHHRQAVEMAALVPSRASSTKVKDLAKQIAGAQDPEIRTMSSWLRGWGEKVPAAGDGHGGMGMDDGMMSDADMAKLKAAKGTAFDTMFARMMIAHHNGAIAMARDEQRNGRNPAAVKLAKQIIRTQTAEVATLRDIAGG